MANQSVTLECLQGALDHLQVYYGRAKHDNTNDIQSMQDAVMAVWHHTQSTDENPDHDLCPPPPPLEKIHGVGLKGLGKGNL